MLLPITILNYNLKGIDIIIQRIFLVFLFFYWYIMLYNWDVLTWIKTYQHLIYSQHIFFYMKKEKLHTSINLQHKNSHYKTLIDQKIFLNIKLLSFKNLLSLMI